MLTIDDRAGSKDLIPYLNTLLIPAKLERMEFGDASLVGRGPEGRPVLVGVEIKAPSDLLQSLTSGRLQAHQLPGLVQAYEVVYLVVEGMPKRAFDGRLLFVGHRVHGDWTFRRLMGQLFTIAEKLGVRLVYTPSRGGTADWLAELHDWWTNKEWELHRSHLADRRVDLDIRPGEWYDVHTPAVARKMKVAKALVDGLGGRARRVAEHFQSVREMVNADAKEWQKIEGVGKTLAERAAAEARRI